MVYTHNICTMYTVHCTITKIYIIHCVMLLIYQWSLVVYLTMYSTCKRGLQWVGKYLLCLLIITHLSRAYRLYMNTLMYSNCYSILAIHYACIH